MKERAPLTVGQLIDLYRTESGEHSRLEDERHAEWWCQEFKEEPTAELTSDRVATALDRLNAYGRASSTVRYYVRFLQRVCGWATRVGFLLVDPCAGLGLPKAPKTAPRVLTPAEETQLCLVLGQPYSLWVQFAILTGLKQSEQFDLKWRDIDLKSGTVRLPQARVVVLLDLCPEAVSVLHDLRSYARGSVYVFPDKKDRLRQANFHSFYTGRWKMAVHRAGIPWVAWKDLRHTCGIRLAGQGYSAVEIARLLRHCSAKRTYIYRAWRPIGPPAPPRPQIAAPPVFEPLTAGEIQQALMLDPAQSPLTFGELCRFYSQHQLQKKDGSREQFDRLFKQFLQPWEDRLATSIQRREIQGLHSSLSHTPSHANKLLSFLKAAFSWADYVELTKGTNPTANIKRYPERSRERVLTVEEVQRLMERLPAIPQKQRAFVLLVLLTGARKSEARKIQWTDIDERTHLWRKPKTKAGGSHVVPLPLQCLRALQGLPRDSPYVFAGLKGNPWASATADKHWAAIRQPLRLVDVTFHDLRRSTATHLSRRRENIQTVAQVLDHRNLSQTGRYVRLDTASMNRALQGQADWLFSLAKDRAHPAPASATAIPNPGDLFVPDDPYLDALIKQEWARIPEALREKYTAAAASLQVPLAQLLASAVEHHLCNLEKGYGLLPNGKQAYAPPQMGKTAEGSEA